MDGALFVLNAFNDPGSATAADYASFLDSNFGSLAPLVARTYPLSDFESTPMPAFYAMETVYTDFSYKCPAWRGLNRAVQNALQTWTYVFNHTLSCPWLAELPEEALLLVGATHTAELPFVFGNINDLPAPHGTCNLTAQDRRLSKDLIEAWTMMAIHGNPGLQWPAFTPSSSLGLTIGNATSAGEVDYSVCGFWEDIYAAQLHNASITNNSSTVSTASGNMTAGGSIANGTVPAGASPSASPAPFTGGTIGLTPFGIGSTVLFGVVFAVGFIV